VKSRVTIFALVFLGSFALGWLGSAISRSAPSSLDQERSAPPSGGSAAIVPEGESDLIPAPPESASASASGTPPGGAAEPSLRGSGFRAIPETALETLRVPVLQPGSPTLSSDIISFFSLSSDEVARLEASLARAEDRLTEIELEKMNVIQSTEDVLVLHLPAFPEEGLALEAALKAAILTELGDDDGEVFWRFLDAPESGSNRRFHGFGRVSRELSFRLEPSSHDPARTAFTFSSETPREEHLPWFIEERRQLGPFKSETPRFRSPEMVSSFFGRYEYLLPVLPEKLASFVHPTE